jgi:hypothetical protein
MVLTAQDHSLSFEYFIVCYPFFYVADCQLQAVKQNTKDLSMRTLVLHYKKYDLEKEAARYKGLCQVAHFFRQPVETGCGGTHLSYTKLMETSCQVSGAQIAGARVMDAFSALKTHFITLLNFHFCFLTESCKMLLLAFRPSICPHVTP